MSQQKCNPNCAYYLKCKDKNPYKPNKICTFDNKYIVDLNCKCHRGNALIL